MKRGPHQVPVLRVNGVLVSARVAGVPKTRVVFARVGVEVARRNLLRPKPNSAMQFGVASVALRVSFAEPGFVLKILAILAVVAILAISSLRVSASLW